MRAEIIANISDKYKSLLPTFSDERSRHLWVAADVQSLGRGGLNAVRAATGMGYFTIKKGLEELKNVAKLPQRLRKIGSGRKKSVPKMKPFRETYNSLDLFSNFISGYLGKTGECKITVF
jgi:hypothetical protein